MTDYVQDQKILDLELFAHKEEVLFQFTYRLFPSASTRLLTHPSSVFLVYYRTVQQPDLQFPHQTGPPANNYTIDWLIDTA